MDLLFVAASIPTDTEDPQLSLVEIIEGRSLDEICSQDPEYKWRQFSDHGIDVRLGSRPLSLIDVPVRNLSVEDARPIDMLVAFLHLPEVKQWEQTTGCQVGHPMIITGNPQADNGWRPSLKIHDEPVWKVLNELSAKNQTYFWSTVGSVGGSCYIVLDILTGK